MSASSASTADKAEHGACAHGVMTKSILVECIIKICLQVLMNKGGQSARFTHDSGHDSGRDSAWPESRFTISLLIRSNRPSPSLIVRKKENNSITLLCAPRLAGPSTCRRLEHKNPLVHVYFHRCTPKHWRQMRTETLSEGSSSCTGNRGHRRESCKLQYEPSEVQEEGKVK